MDAGLVIEILMTSFTITSVLLYIRCQIVLYRMIKRDTKEKLAAYFYILYFCGFVNLFVIVNQIAFQLLPSLVWQKFFYSLGSMGARVNYMVNFGSEMFVLLCEAFIAISRYLTFVHNDTAHTYWHLAKVRKCLLVILGISVIYASTYFFCQFSAIWNPEKTSVQFMFAQNTLHWVGISMFVPFTVASASFFSCVYCYSKVATIIKGSPTGLTRTTVMKMCLSSAIISFGAFFLLLVRITNHLSYLLTGDDVIPLALFLFLIRIGTLIATCGSPWILVALFPTVRNKAFPWCKRKQTRTIIFSTTALSVF